MNPWLQLTIALFGAGFASAVVTAIANRRRQGADTTKIITEAAGGIVGNLERDNERLRHELVQVREELARATTRAESKIEHLERAVQIADRRERMHLLMEERNANHLERWHRYCTRQGEALRELGAIIDDPPPLWPEPIQPEGRDAGLFGD